MSKEKFSILGPDGEEVGFAILSLPQAEAPGFQHVANQALLDGPIADVALLFGSLAGFTGFAWLAFGPGWAAPVTGLTITAVLAGIKAWRGGWPLPTEAPAAETSNNIKVTMTDQDTDTIYIDYFYDKTVELDKVAALAKLIVANNLTWLGRPTVCRETALSQTDYNKIRAEFVKQNYLLELDNNHSRLTRRGRAIIRELSARSMPHPTSSPLQRPLLGGTVASSNKQQARI